tara:strand:+ start:256887 stop:257048 length:162 start_codon:yes stop_codon:yes gene_type:complete
MSIIKALLVLSTATILSSCSSFSAKPENADVEKNKKDQQAINEMFPRAYYDRI